MHSCIQVLTQAHTYTQLHSYSSACLQTCANTLLPPSIGPTMNPMLDAALKMPKTLDLSSGGVTSASRALHTV